MQTLVSHPAPMALRLVAVLAVASLLVAPFAVLEAVNTRGAQLEPPATLFAFMFVHAALIAASLQPALLRLVSTRSLRTLRLAHGLGVALGCALIAVYVGVVMDQWPCFMGVPNCD